MEIHIALGAHSYDIILQRGCLSQAGKLLQLERRVLLVTDDGVPQAYADTVAKQCLAPEIVTIPQGEASKSLASFERLLTHMLQSGFTRKDCVVAVGGGVVGGGADGGAQRRRTLLPDRAGPAFLAYRLRDPKPDAECAAGGPGACDGAALRRGRECGRLRRYGDLL